MKQSSASDANSTENARKQKQGDKRTSIKNMTEMYNNFPAPDYMKQLVILTFVILPFVLELQFHIY